MDSDSTLSQRARGDASKYKSLVDDLLRSVSSISESRTDSGIKPTQVEGQIDRLLRSLVATDAALERTREEALAQSRLQDSIDRLRSELDRKDQVFQALSGRVVESIRTLEAGIEDADFLLERAEVAESRPTPVQKMLEYSQMIGYTTSAPPDWKPGMSLLPYLPPVPREQEMRASRLFRQSLAPSMKAVQQEQAAVLTAEDLLQAFRKQAVIADDIDDAVVKQYLPKDWRPDDALPPLPKHERLLAETKRHRERKKSGAQPTPAAASESKAVAAPPPRAVKRPREESGGPPTKANARIAIGFAHDSSDESD